MRNVSLLVPVMVLAGCASAPAAVAPSPGDAKAKVAPVEYRSAFEGYRPFADQELQDWRRANDEVGAAGGHMGHRPGQGAGQQTSKPQPGKPESPGGPAEHRGHQR